MSDNSTNVSDNDFDQQVLEADELVLVDFWAEWCQPCKMIGPIVEEVATTYPGRVKVVKVNIDQCNNTAARFGIRSIPTLMLFKNGEVADTKIGALSKTQLMQFVDGQLGS